MPATSLHRLHARLRASFRPRKARPPVNLRQQSNGLEPTQMENDGVWRADFQRMDELERAEMASADAARAYAVGGVVIFGSHRFYGPGAPRSALDSPFSDKAAHEARNLTLRYEAHGEVDFAVRWADAICAEIGLEEFHAFLLARRQRHVTDLR